MQEQSSMEVNYLESAIGIIQPVLEMSMVTAAEYAKACGRDTVVSMDLEYAMKYCAMTMVGKKIGSHFPEIYEEDDDEDEDEDDDVEVVDDEPEFERYAGADEIMNAINECYDAWDAWVPESPVESMIKNAINNHGTDGMGFF